jgi:hypothetical protein
VETSIEVSTSSERPSLTTGNALSSRSGLHAAFGVPIAACEVSPARPSWPCPSAPASQFPPQTDTRNWVAPRCKSDALPFSAPSARSLRFFAFRLRFCAAGDCASASFSIWRIEGVKRGFEPAIPRVGCRGMVKKVNLFGQLIGAFLGSFGRAVGSRAKEEPKRVGCMCKQLRQSIHARSSFKPSLSVRPSCTLGICLAA